MLKLKGGLEVTEKELTCWDNVPTDAEIEAVALGIERKGFPPYIIEIKGYEEICVGKIGSSVGGGPTKIVGFAVFCVASDNVTEFTIKNDGVTLRNYSRSKLTIRPEALRRMAA